MAFLVVLKPHVSRLPFMMHLRGLRTVGDRLNEHGDAARGRLAPGFRAAAVNYPPGRVTLVGMKWEKRLDVYAADTEGQQAHYVTSYPLLGASGGLGPKLRYGDRQVPEGIYAIEALNPNSSFHLSLRLDYPNAFDRGMGRKDGRDNLGRDIMIHGGRASIGCLAVGDEAAEDLFVLAADAGLANTDVILTPVDFRKTELPSAVSLAGWAPELYGTIRSRLHRLPLPDRQAAPVDDEAERTVGERIREFGPAARGRLEPYFRLHGLGYPPERVTLLGLKHERVLELYAGGASGGLRFVRRYPVLAASGDLGPKLRYGDRQVPEGVYRVTSLNPNSICHVSLRLGYPNAFDRAMARQDGRDDPGRDIMIHGGRVSIGCLAVGDEGAEDLFALVYHVGPADTEVIISPVDFRTTRTPSIRDLPPWADELYEDLEQRLARLPHPPDSL